MERNSSSEEIRKASSCLEHYKGYDEPEIMPEGSQSMALAQNQCDMTKVGDPLKCRIS